MGSSSSDFITLHENSYAQRGGVKLGAEIYKETLNAHNYKSRLRLKRESSIMSYQLTCMYRTERMSKNYFPNSVH